MFIKTRTCRLSLNNELTQVHVSNSEGAGQKKENGRWTSDKAAFSQAALFFLHAVCLTEQLHAGAAQTQLKKNKVES